VVEEFLRLAGVLAGDAVGGAEDAEGAEGDVFEVADGRGDEVEAGGEGAVGCAVALIFVLVVGLHGCESRG
jgi:hypothetical protein